MNPVLVTGGAGFIGTNLADRLLCAGRPVVLLDDLSRPGVGRNLRWLVARHRHKVHPELVDVRDPGALGRIVARACAIYHFAAQTAVTTSLNDPEHDFDVNARGTLRLLEAVRESKQSPPLVFTSTHKVYGGLSDIALHKRERRHVPSDARLRKQGISETRPLAFETPYGCSKGAAEQYVLEYARCYGLRSTVFRMSSIYGPHQCGTEDQGWVAHFALCALQRRPICIYGDGMQVRDLLYVDDLVDALLLAVSQIDRVAGHAFNIGGGPERMASVLEVVEHIERLHGTCAVSFGPWRAGDQRYYVANTGKFQQATGWRPRLGVPEGIERLYAWLLQEHRGRGDTWACETERPSSDPTRPAMTTPEMRSARELDDASCSTQ